MRFRFSHSLFNVPASNMTLSSHTDSITHVCGFIPAPVEAEVAGCGSVAPPGIVEAE